MTRTECIHILRNPYGHSTDEVREARLFACDEIERLKPCAGFMDVDVRSHRGGAAAAGAQAVANGG